MVQNKSKNIKEILLGIIAALALIGIDQWVKYWVYNSLRVNGPITLIKGVFSFTYTYNPGAAWGMMNGSILLNILPVILGIIIIFVFYRIPATKRMLPINISIVMFFSGAISNWIDRLTYGYVQDFLYFELINFPIFNIADCYIVISAIFLAFLLIFYYKDEDEFSGMFSLKKDKTKDE